MFLPMAMNKKMIAAFAAIYFCWGATFLALRWSVAEIPPLLTIALRCGAGGLLILAGIAATGGSLRASKAEWLTAVRAGLLLFVGGHGILAWASQRVASGEASLFMTAIPMWLVLIDSVHRRSPPSRRVLAGLAVGAIGVAVLSIGGGEWSGRPIERVGLLVSGACWGLGSIIGRDGARPKSAFLGTAMQLLVGSIATVLVSIALGEAAGWNPANVTVRGAGAMAFMIIGGTVLGFGAYTWLLRVTTPAAVGTYAFVNPVVALSLAALVGDGEISLRVMIAAVLVLSAVALVREHKAHH
jgi:drug/metabolite transporter (DMT)-like permease